MKIVWVALLGTHVMLLVLTHVLLPPMEGVTESFNPQIFMGLAGLMLVLSRFLPRFLVKGALTNTSTTATMTEYDPTAISRTQAGAIYVSFIIQLALLESISLMGFVLGRTQGRLDLQRVFAAVAILSVLAAYPKSLTSVRDRLLGK